MEGVRIIIRKDGSLYGTLLLHQTFGHGSLYQTATPEWIGIHPAAYIEDKGHGIKPWNDGHFPADCGGMGIWYAGRGAETPSHCNDRDVSMDLIPFEETLWAQRFGDAYRDTGSFVSGAFFGTRYGGNDGYGRCKANPPWNWFGDSGSWFMDPRAHYVCCSSEAYLSNEYLSNTQSGGVNGCG